MKKLRLKKATQLAPREYSIDYKTKLNSGQYEAVMHNKGAALVLAGAGSGKTMTLVYRVSRLIEDGIDPREILLLTFTRKAGAEMVSRIATLLDGRATYVTAGTFHSFALKMLKMYSKEIGFTQEFSVIDQQDAEDTIDLLRAQRLPPKMKKRFPKINTLQKILSLSINKRISTLEVLEENYPKFVEYEDQINTLFIDYHSYKKKSNAMDYDDLLLYLLELLKENADVRSKITNMFRYLMIDEYQDTNRLQHEIVLLLGGTENNIMAVGDDAQSIYSFRGAEHNNIFFFPESFEDCTIYKLEQNYRSTEQILNLCNEVINRAAFKYDKKLFSRDRIGEKPYLIAANQERQQSEFVAQQILELREEGINLEDMAVLFRSSYHSFDLEIDLNKSNIPYIKFGGMKFIETAHIKDMISYMKLLFNPKDVVAWQRVLMLIDGVGPATARKIISSIAEGQLTIDNYKNALPLLNKNIGITNLFKLVASHFDTADITNSATEIAIYYKEYLDAKYDNTAKRWKDIETFLQIADQYKDLPTFLNDMALDPPVNSLDELEPESEEDEYLTLSTIHSAKGLEWKVVFLIWATEGKFPSAKSTHTVDSVEEERRLFYVALTRAKDNLYIISPFGIFDRESGTVLSEPSRFIRDIGEDLLEKFILTEDNE
jgi:DNA helicase-2/ATP-dependent DNA helicase PcrA